MYVCICNSVTDSAIREAVSEGVVNLDQLAARTGCGTGCGCCREFAQAELETALRRQAKADIRLPAWQTA